MKLKDLEKKYDLSDLEFFSQGISTQKLSFTANKIKQSESSHISGSCIRLIKNNQIGFSAKYGDANIDELINTALETCPFSPQTNISFPSQSKSITNLTGYHSDITGLMKETGKEIIDRFLTLEQNILTDISFDIINTKEDIQNSKGLDYSYNNQIYSISIGIRHTSENDFIEIYTGEHDNKPVNYKDLVDEIIFLFKHTKKHSKIKNGSFPVLFTSKAAKDLFNIIEIALNGKEVNNSSSPWSNKLGEKVLNSKLSISQDPSFGFIKRSIDDEGSNIKKLNLIKNGILKDFYFDLNSATKGKNETAGNGFKDSLITQPQPALLNMIISSGLKTREEIIKNINYGLLIDQTMGGLSSNISGDISINVDIGFLIENGEITGRIKDTMVSGNVYNSLNNVIEISNNPQWHGTNIYCADILLDGFTIASR
jgi:PmbA protein